MDEKRKREIALMVLDYQIAQEDLQLNPIVEQEIYNVSKETEISQDELKEFVKDRIKEKEKKKREILRKSIKKVRQIGG